MSHIHAPPHDAGHAPACPASFWLESDVEQRGSAAGREPGSRQLVQVGIPCHQAETLAETITAYRSNQATPHPSVQAPLEQYRTGIQRVMVLPRGLMTA